MLQPNQEMDGGFLDLATELRPWRWTRGVNLGTLPPGPMTTTVLMAGEARKPWAAPAPGEAVGPRSAGVEPAEEVTLWERVRRSMLAEWCLAYSATAFVVLEAMDVFSDVWGWPLAIQKLITVLLGLGLVITAALAWFRSEGGGAKGWCLACGIDLLIIAGMIGGLVVAVQLSVLITG